jgi:hypothetical protein
MMHPGKPHHRIKEASQTGKPEEAVELWQGPLTGKLKKICIVLAAFQLVA